MPDLELTAIATGLQQALARHGLLTGWVLAAEFAGADRERSLVVRVSDGLTIWNATGMVVTAEQMIRDEICDE